MSHYVDFTENGVHGESRISQNTFIQMSAHFSRGTDFRLFVLFVISYYIGRKPYQFIRKGNEHKRIEDIEYGMEN